MNYGNQIVQHNPCFNLYRLQNNLFNNQETNFLSTTIYLVEEIFRKKQYIKTYASIITRLSNEL